MYSIFKTFILSVLMVAQVHFAYAQNAAILPPAKTTFVDQNGKPLTAGTVDFYIPGTTTRKTTWQDSAATIANTNPVVLDSAGRGIILGNGAYRQVVKDRVGNIIWDQVTNSAGAGGSGNITAGDGLSVGTILPWSGFIAPVNYAFTYGQEISRTTYSSLKVAITITQNITCTSGNATLTSVSDTTQLNIGAAVEAACVPAASTIISKTANTVTISNNASVSTTNSAVFYPWGNGNGLTTFNVPDLRGVVLPGRNNMGGASSSNLTTSFYTDPNSLAGRGGAQSKLLLTSNMPSHTHPNSLADPGHAHTAFHVSSGTGGAADVTVGGGAHTITDLTAVSTTGITLTNVQAGGGIAVSAAVSSGGSGYTAGTQLLTVSGGTCTTQPQFNVTVVAGAITAPVLVTAGECSITPVNPAATTGGGGTGGQLSIIYSAIPIPTIQPSKTINYVIKLLPDINLSIARCADISDAGTACTANIGTSGATVPLLSSINTWSALQTFTSGVNISGGTTTIANLAAPVNPADAATKAYVDSVATGLNILAQTRLATAAVLPNTPTYANGASGVGATLTAGANSTLTVDGTIANLNDVVLVKNQASAFQNGIYTVTQAGSGAAPWILTRATYFDQAAEMKAGSYTLITAGVTNISTSWVLQTAVTTVGTDPLNWILFSQVGGVSSLGGMTGAITCGTGLTCATGTISAVKPYVMPADYGFTCDGVTDVTTAFQTMVTASSGKTIFIPAGPPCVLSAHINLISNIAIIGGGREVSGLKMIGQDYFFNITNIDNVFIDNFYLLGTNSYTSWAASPIGAINIQMSASHSNFTFKRLKLSGMNATYWILGGQATSGIISNTTFDDILVVTDASSVPTDADPLNNSNFILTLYSGTGGLRWENTTITNWQITQNFACFGITLFSNHYKWDISNNRILSPGGANPSSHCTNGLGATNAYGITVYDLNSDGNPPSNGIIAKNYVLAPIAAGIYIVGDGAATTRAANTDVILVTGNEIVSQTHSDVLLPRGAIVANLSTDISITSNMLFSNATGINVASQNSGQVSVLSNHCNSAAGSSICLQMQAGANGSSNTDRRIVRGNYFEALLTSVTFSSQTGARWGYLEVSGNTIIGGTNGISFANQFVSGVAAFTNNYVSGTNSFVGLTGPLVINNNSNLSLTVATLPAANNGSSVFVSDATSGGCAAAGTGSTAFRQNGAWKCF